MERQCQNYRRHGELERQWQALNHKVANVICSTNQKNLLNYILKHKITIFDLYRLRIIVPPPTSPEASTISQENDSFYINVVPYSIEIKPKAKLHYLYGFWKLIRNFKNNIELKKTHQNLKWF